MIGTQKWTNTYKSTRGDPMSKAFKYKRSPQDKIEQVLKKNCLCLGVPAWVEGGTIYTFDISDDFENTRTFLSCPKEKEPYTTTIIIKSMPANISGLPKGLSKLLSENNFKSKRK